MRHCAKYIILFFFICLCTVDAVAQDKRDTTRFDAMDYSMQKRFNYKSERFVNSKWYDNTFLSLYMGTAQIYDDSETSYSMGTSAGFRLGKWFDDANGVGLGVAWRSFRKNNDGTEVFSHNVAASYMYNLTSNLHGYSATNFCDAVLVAGLGLLTNTTQSGTNVGLDAHLGLSVVMRPFKYVDFFIEPLGHFESMQAESKKFRFSYSINMGLTYTHVSRKELRPKTDFRKDRFISLIGGANLPVSTLVSTVGFFDAIGPHGSIAYGRWFSDLFALRISGFYESDIWNRYLDEFAFEAYYYGARIEGMFEFLHLMPDFEKLPVPMTLSLLAGPEIGMMHKEDIQDIIFTPYVGLTTAVQYRCKIGGPVYFLVEPRFSFIPFNFNAIGNNDVVYANYLDVIFNLNVGLDFEF